MAEVVYLTEFRYAEPVPGELMKLYLYGPDGKHSGRQYFRRIPRYTQGEVDIDHALQLALQAVGQGNEIRVTNAGDELLFRLVVDGRGHVCEAFPHDRGIMSFFGGLR